LTGAGPVWGSEVLSGFNIVTFAAFMAELGLARGEWELDGCLMGLPLHPLTPSAEHLPENAVVCLK
jgi:hypothetical protein